jgi:hypothetical protein
VVLPRNCYIKGGVIGVLRFGLWKELPGTLYLTNFVLYTYRTTKHDDSDHNVTYRYTVPKEIKDSKIQTRNVGKGFLSPVVVEKFLRLNA